MRAVQWAEGSATVQGNALAWRRAGPPGAPRVLYLHDAGADTLASAMFDVLAADHDVVVVDLPGYGRSGPPVCLDDPVRVGDLLAGALDELGWQAAVVVGTSLGGWFALELALAHPGRVAALVLCDTAGLQVPQDYLLSLFVKGRAAQRTEQLIRQALVGRLAPEDRDLDTAPPAVAAAILGPFVQSLAAAAATSWHPATANPRLLGRLAEVACPTTVLWGERDALIPLTHGRLLAAGIPGARLVVVAGAGHLLALEHPEVVVDAVRALTRPG
jgi:pimeloyl-ACP methyl ester carboxylesterase